uniref:Ig-like domain-containing protein n=1 Tax=Neogobius melanostomus TaxID=47308 RepID=A0A8C6V0M1_9GOBI
FFVCVVILASSVLSVLGVALCAAEIVHQTKPGKTETLNCGITGASKWLRGSDLLHSVHPGTGMPLRGKGEIVQRSRMKQGRNLEISRITPQDAGLFTCSGNRQEEHHRLVVSSASVSPSARLEVGSEATLQCEVSGLPQGAAVEWVRPGGGQRHRTSRLQLSSVALTDAGSWECVFSVGGKTLNETVTLQVTVMKRAYEVVPVKNCDAVWKVMNDFRHN